MRLVKDWIRSVKILVSSCDSDLQVARSHHIPRVRLRPWVSLVALQEVEEGGGYVSKSFTDPFQRWERL